MKLAIITTVAVESSRYLANALKQNGVDARVFDFRNPYVNSFETYDYVFSYGCSEWTRCKKGARINSPEAIKRCVDKVETFKAFKKAGVATVDYVTDYRKVPADWEWVVCRESRTGRKAEGYVVCEADHPVVGWPLYTKYFDHVREYRVIVAFGQAFVYFKKVTKNGDDDWHEFRLQRACKHGAMVRDALTVAKALKMDYVGFDVLVNSKGVFKFLEANSAAMMTEEACNHIVGHFLNQ